MLFYKLSRGTYTHYDSITPFFVIGQSAIYNYGKNTNFVIQYCIPALNFIIWLCIILSLEVIDNMFFLVLF